MKQWALEAIIVTYLSFITCMVSSETRSKTFSTEASSNVTASRDPDLRQDSLFYSRGSQSSSSSVSASPSIQASSSYIVVTSPPPPPSDLRTIGSKNKIGNESLSTSPSFTSSATGVETFRSFDRYSVLRLTPTSKEQLAFLKQLQLNDSKVSD